jgi:hypothetical protein
MGAHSTPRGEHSTMQGTSAKAGNTAGYQGKHRLEDKLAGSDLPPRDAKSAPKHPPRSK